MTQIAPRFDSTRLLIEQLVFRLLTGQWQWLVFVMKWSYSTVNGKIKHLCRGLVFKLCNCGINDCGPVTGCQNY
jgi:hypothetical protein